MHPLLEAPMYGLVRRILRGQFPPLRPGAQNPQHPVQHRARVRRRTTASVGALGKPQQRFQHSPICIRHLSPCPHLCFRRIASANSFVPPTTSNLKPKTTSTIYQTGSSVFHVAAIFLPQLCILVVLLILCCLPTPLQQSLRGQQAAKCAGLARAGSQSNRLSLSFVYKGRVQK